MTIDKAWFCEQIHMHQSEMYRIAYRILQNKEDTDDAVQETLYRAYTNLESIRKPEYFKTWIIRILMNTSYEILKKKYNLNIDDYTEMIGESEDITTSVMMEKAIAGLEENYRNVIILYYYEDFSVKEISKILNLSVMNVKQRLSRSRKMLKEILSERGKKI